MNRLHERGLSALLNDETSTFNDMLSKSNNTTDYWILQIYLRSFCSHKERKFYKNTP